MQLSNKAMNVMMLSVTLSMGLGAFWPERFTRSAKGGLVRPSPDVSLIMKELAWSIQNADRQMHESERDQMYVDISLLLCERVGFGVFARVGDHYECLHPDGRVLFKHEVGKEMFWWTMQGFGFPRAPKGTKPADAGAAPPWVAYEP